MAANDLQTTEQILGRVKKWTQKRTVYDISANHLTNGNPTKYADLQAALGTDGKNVPVDVRHGGMEVCFVSSSDNKYVQYRLMSETFNTTVANWQGVDDEPTAGSDNLVKSGGVDKFVNEVTDVIRQNVLALPDLQRYTGCIDSSLTLIDYKNSKYVVLKVKGGDIITKSELALNYFVVLRDFDYAPELPYSFAFADGETGRRNRVKDFTLPQDASYILLAIEFDGQELLPSVLTINGVDITVKLSDNIERDKENAIKSNAVFDAIQKRNVYGAPTGLASMVSLFGHLDAGNNGSIVDYQEARHILVPVTPGDVIYLERSHSATGFAFVKDYDFKSALPYTLNMATGSSVVNVPSRGIEVQVPSDAKYMILRALYNYTNNVLPTKCVVNGFYDLTKSWIENHNDLDEEVSKINFYNRETPIPILGYYDIRDNALVISEGQNYKNSTIVPVRKVHAGDTIGLESYDDAQYWVYFSTDNVLWSSTSWWQKADYTFEQDCYIGVMLRRPSSTEEPDPSKQITSGFFIITPSVSERLNYVYKNEIYTIEKSVSELPRINGWVDSSNVFYVASNYGLHSVVKISKDKPYLRVKASSNDFFMYFVLKSYKEPVVGANTPDFCSTISGFQRVRPVNSVAIIDLSAPDANYIAFNVFNVSQNKDVSPQEFEFFSKYEIDKLEAEWWEGDSELHNNLIQIKRRVNDTTQQVNYNAYLNHTPILSFLWFSDLHDDVPRLKRIMKFANQHPSYYDDIVCTGDANDKFTNNFDYWHDLGCDNVLLSIGNHEQYYETEEGGVTTGHHDVSQEQMYNKYYKDFVQGQGVVYQTNKVYWYKDYINNKIRLINICPSLYHISSEAVAEQLTWFEEVLADAAENNLAVVVMNHYKATPCVFIDSNFTQLDGVTGGTTMTDLLNAVKDFKTSGGEFICWLSGHEHQDRLSYKDTWNDQLFITINCAMMESSYSDMSRVAGTRSEDCFNMIGFDVDKKLIKMVRVGANVDYLLRPRNLIVINYTNNQILNQK